MLTCNLCGDTTRRDTSKEHDCVQNLKKRLEDANLNIGELKDDLTEANEQIEAFKESIQRLQAEISELKRCAKEEQKKASSCE
jgi:predicted  nucleic acid-binding Zn-ribbon protein